MASMTLYNSGDTFVRSSEATSNKGTLTYMALGRTSGSQINRTLIGFDFSPVAGKIIDSAIMYLYQDYSSYCYSNEIVFYAQNIATSWSETGATWNAQPSRSSTGQVTLSLSGNADGLRAFSITGLVQDIIHNSRTSYGIALVQANEGLTNKRKQFFTEEYGSGSRRPYIVVSYHDMNLWGYTGGAFRLAKEVYVYSGGAWRTSKSGSAVYSGGWKSFK